MADDKVLAEIILFHRNAIAISELSGETLAVMREEGDHGDTARALDQEYYKRLLDSGIDADSIVELLEDGKKVRQAGYENKFLSLLDSVWSTFELKDLCDRFSKVSNPKIAKVLAQCIAKHKDTDWETLEQQLAHAMSKNWTSTYVDLIRRMEISDGVPTEKLIQVALEMESLQGTSDDGFWLRTAVLKRLHEERRPLEALVALYKELPSGRLRFDMEDLMDTNDLLRLAGRSLEEVEETVDATEPA